MADHSKQISKLRDAAFRGWVEELQDVEQDRLADLAGDNFGDADTTGPLPATATAKRLAAARPEPNSPRTRTRANLDDFEAEPSEFITPHPQPSSPWKNIPPVAHTSGHQRIDITARPGATAQEPVPTNSVSLSPTQDHHGVIIEATQKLIKDLRLMKRTRFNAQARFEAKHRISVAAFTLAAVFEIGLSLAGTNFMGVLPKNVASFIEFSAQVTAVFILGFGLVATLNNYQTQALYLQRCAMDWGNLSRELQIAQPVSRDILQDYRRRYHEIEGRCPPNHAYLDLQRARLNDDSDPGDVRANSFDYFLDVYLVYALSAIGYVTFFGLGLWHTIS